MPASFKNEIETGQRFEFGKNWQSFLKAVSAERVRMAEQSLKSMLGLESLAGKTFLDLGCGSGLFSLAARRLGARVHSCDYDPASVACAQCLKDRFFQNDPQWTTEPGSVLDRDYLAGLGQFDVVYSWGVLHHTGVLWQALGNVCARVSPDGTLFISIYNDQGWISCYWKFMKRQYNRGAMRRTLVIALHFPYLMMLVPLVQMAPGQVSAAPRHVALA